VCISWKIKCLYKLILKIFKNQLLRTILPSTERISEDEVRGAHNKNRGRKNERSFWKEKAYCLTSGYELVFVRISSVQITLVNKSKSKFVSVLI
jgi:hypothetical protein